MNGCNKSNVLSPEIGKTTPVLLQIIKDSSSYVEYSYENGMISEYKYYSSGKLRKTVQLKYNSNCLTESQVNIQLYEDYKLVYSYDSDKRIIKADRYMKSDSGYEKFGYLKFNYDVKNRINKYEQYLDYVPTPSFRMELDYDGVGNLASEHIFMGEELYESVTWEYDTKINPLNGYRKSDLFTIMFGPNNLIKKTETEYYPGGQSKVETRYTYTYNNIGYPDSRKVEEIRGNSITESVEIYKYK
jgi:hypothetical protein